MKKLMFALLVLVMTAVAGGAATANASQVDMLIKKLVEKGILSATEAEALISEMQKEEAGKAPEKAAVEAEKGKVPSLPKWVEKIDLKGDFRLRYQREETTNTNQGTRNRGRYRLRAGLVADVTDQWETGFGICSGGANPRSSLQTFSTGFETPDLRLDYAFATYMPYEFGSITGGKFKQPLWQPSFFLWDNDIRPEGAAVQLRYKLDKGKGIEVFATPAFFVLEEFGNKEADPVMWVLQAGSKWNITDRLYLKAAGSYYVTDNVAGNSFTYSAGTNSTNAAGKLIYEYNTLTADVEAGFTLPGPVPFFAITGTYVRNTSVDDDLDGDGHDDNQGWLAGFKCGHSKLDKFGKWQFIYDYRRLERDAWLDILPHSAFYNGSTNVKGHKLAFLFGLHKNINLTADYYRAEQIRLNPDNLEREQNWLAIDLNLKW